jgi:hypothetical protein
MANGLHAMAQPLTVLRSSIGAALHGGRTANDQKTYLDISAEQVERACAIFHSLRQLLLVKQGEPALAPLDLAAFLAPIVEEQNAGLNASGVTLHLTMPADPPAAFADMDRTVHALFTVLRVAASLCSRGDVIGLRVAPENDGVTLTVETTRAHGKRLDSSDRLNLALAEANIRSQDGRYHSGDDPFFVAFTLPLLSPGNSGGEDPWNGFSGPHRVHSTRHLI